MLMFVNKHKAFLLSVFIKHRPWARVLKMSSERDYRAWLIAASVTVCAFSALTCYYLQGRKKFANGSQATDKKEDSIPEKTISESLKGRSDQVRSTIGLPYSYIIGESGPRWSCQIPRK